MICRESCIKAHGTIALYPAFRDGDDVKVLDEGRDNVIATLHGFRQQVRKSATASLHFSIHMYVHNIMYVCNFYSPSLSGSYVYDNIVNLLYVALTRC